MASPDWVILLVVPSIVAGIVIAVAPEPLKVVTKITYSLYVFSLAAQFVVGKPLIGVNEPGLLARIGGPISGVELALGAFVVLAAIGGILEGS